MATKLSDYRPFRFSKLETPITITEGQGEVEVLSLSDTMPSGIYLISVSIVSAFTTANDRISWRATGTSPSPSFLIEAKDASENVPFAYGFPFEHAGGVLEFNLLASIAGAGLADVDVVAANITFERKGE